MTFTLLARDQETGRFAGAAATGSLCVGGWVLRGDSKFGLSASQGTAPSTLWGEDVLTALRSGAGAADAVAQITGNDPGRDHRQLAALDAMGGTGAFTGAQSIAACHHRSAPNIVAIGNMLHSEAVIDALFEAYLSGTGDLGARLLSAMDAAAQAGGDSRGLQSAALLVVGTDMPPLTLRIDCSATPLDDLRMLHARATSPPYADWVRVVPTAEDPHRTGP